jgi:hypothetical protein
MAWADATMVVSILEANPALFSDSFFYDVLGSRIPSRALRQRHDDHFGNEVCLDQAACAGFPAAAEPVRASVRWPTEGLAVW